MEVKDSLMLNVVELLEMEDVLGIVDQEVLELTNGELEELEEVMEEMEGIVLLVNLLLEEKGVEFMWLDLFFKRLF